MIFTISIKFSFFRDLKDEVPDVEKNFRSSLILGCYDENHRFCTSAPIYNLRKEFLKDMEYDIEILDRSYTRFKFPSTRGNRVLHKTLLLKLQSIILQNTYNHKFLFAFEPRLRDEFGRILLDTGRWTFESRTLENSIIGPYLDEPDEDGTRTAIFL